ncbi:MAG: hypothetical protein ABFD92_06125 [Planctomycetaceae bacterium]|nr:hypothetical protein [Planctomycetaceae bacterium]
MSDKPESNIAGRISASAEMLEAAVAELLRLIPESWQRTCAAGMVSPADLIAPSIALPVFSVHRETA